MPFAVVETRRISSTGRLGQVRPSLPRRRVLPLLESTYRLDLYPIGHKYMAGAAGFEPAHGGIKSRCLTAWRRPKGRANPARDSGI